MAVLRTSMSKAGSVFFRPADYLFSKPYGIVWETKISRGDHDSFKPQKVPPAGLRQHLP